MRTTRAVISFAAAAALGVAGLIGTSVAPNTALTAEVTQAQAADLSGYPNLKQGSTGVSVKILQRLLIANGQSIAVDGSFGPATHSAVLAFQKSKGLAADGSVGPATWGAIIPELRQGDTGAKVTALQHTLNLRGAALAVDGSFGPATLAAVKAAQTKGGVTADGVAGPNTWRVLVNGTTGGGTTRAQLAQQIRADSGITLLHFCGPAYASPGQNILDTANGGQASAGGGDVGDQKVWLSTNMLKWMRDYGQSHSYRVTAIVGCDHSSNSRHYRGWAVDIDYADGTKISTTTAGRTVAGRIKSSCQAAGATEILGPGDSGHSGHVHCAWSS
ncbi:peptidoglycan-binding protein [Propionibacteriaceae bacterium Y1685]